MMDGVGFGGEVGKVMLSWFPFQFKMLLGNAVLDPMVTHGDGFGSADFCGLVSNRASGGVVIYNLGWLGLWVAEVFKNLASDFSVLSVEVQSCIFGFSCGSDYGRYDARGYQDRSINVVWIFGTSEGHWTHGENATIS